MGRLPESPEKRRQMLIHLIQTTEGIIAEEGFASATIRAISGKADCNSASLYKYFQDLDELLLYACVKRFKNYLAALAGRQEFQNTDDPKTIYLLTWELFCAQAFEAPESTYQLFFSKHSPDIKKIISSYFELFPEELSSTPLRLLTMVKAADLRKRNWKVLYPVLMNKVSNSQLVLINDLTIAYFQMLLNEKRLNPENVHNDMQTARMLQTCEYLISKTK